MDQKLPEAHRRWKEKTNGERGGGKIRGFLRVVPELEILQHQQGWCCEWTPCLRWRRAPISIPPLDLSLILARLCGEGGDYVGEHYWQEGRHGAVRASMKADECTWSLDFCFLCLVHVSLPLRRKEDAVVFVYVSCCDEDMFCLFLLYVQANCNGTTLSWRSLVDMGCVF